MTKDKIDACDVFDWTYLVELADRYDPEEIRSFQNRLAKLAYDLTQTSDETTRNEQFSQFIHRVTDNCSVETAEEFVNLMVANFRCDEGKLRKYMKHDGVKLKRKLW